MGRLSRLQSAAPRVSFGVGFLAGTLYVSALEFEAGDVNQEA
jgi:hypothetical protein